VIDLFTLPNFPSAARASPVEHQPNCMCWFETVSVTVQTASADFVCAYPLLAHGTSSPAVAVVISADVLTADSASPIAVLISVGVTVRLPSVPVA
jgi:hypothetical protein